MKQLKRLYSLLDDYSKVLQQLVRADKLGLYLNSPHRRRKLARLDALMHNEIKLVLEAAGISPNSQDFIGLRSKSVLRILTPEGQMFWSQAFEGDLSIDANMVPWNRFLPRFLQYAVGKDCTSIDIETELLLKHVLDHQELDCVTPSRFSDFLLTFGPLQQSIQNVLKRSTHTHTHHSLSGDLSDSLSPLTQTLTLTHSLNLSTGEETVCSKVVSRFSLSRGSDQIVA
jgi:hypothetical protein